jgi:hypothetical protein
LSVSKAQGNKLYNITPEQWETIMEAAGGWESDVIGLVQGKEALRSSIAQFQTMAENNPSLARELIRQSSYFVYDPIQQQYGPSKFIAWTGINEALYLKARESKEGLAGTRFCGHITREHISTMLGRPYIPVPQENPFFIQWAENLLGADVLKGINPNNWKFLSIDGPLQHDIEEIAVQQEVNSLQNSGQRYSSDPIIRNTIEMYGMKKAIEYFQERGWKVTDTSAHKPYDLLCSKGAEKKYIEVKGTTSAGEHVFVTYNEVEHARSHKGQCILFVVHNIEIQCSESKKFHARGGSIQIQDPWIPTEKQLIPVSYRYSLS